MPLNTKTISLSPGAAVSNGIATSQTGSANTPLTINGSLASGGVATLDKIARRVQITSAGNDSAISFVIVGTDRYGRAQSETLAGAGTASATSVRDYLTVTSITPTGNVATSVLAGTNGTLSSDLYVCDWVPNGNLIGAALEFSSTGAAGVQETLDDYSPAWDQVANTFVWFNDSNLNAVTQNTKNVLAGPFTGIRLTVTSYAANSTITLRLITPFIGGRL